MKKTLYVLFALIFLLPLGNASAHAQAMAQRTSFAYIPLLSPQGSASLPVEFRARQAFETLAPQLLEAQAKGQIVRFEPEFSFGLLKVGYKSGFNLAAALAGNAGANPPVFDNSKSVLGYTGVSKSLRSSAVAAASATPYIDISLYEDCFDAGNMGANDYYKAYLKDTSGRLVGSAHGYADASGGIDDCFDGIWNAMTPSFNFSLQVYDNTGTTLLNTYSTRIASSLSITIVSVPYKTAKGTAPANSKLTARLWHRNLDASGDYAIYTEKSVTASSTGAWKVNFSPSVMRGGDLVEISWSRPETVFSFSRYLVAPHIFCGLGTNYCDVTGKPGTSVTLTVVHGKKTYIRSGTFSSLTGDFYVQLNDSYGVPIFLAAGDKISATGVTTMAIPSITAVPNYAADTITGTAPASRYFEVEVEIYNSSGSESGNKWVGSDATTGNYSADFSGLVTMQSTDILYAHVDYIGPSTGNEIGYTNYIAP